MKLYSYISSSTSIRIRLIFQLKKVKYQHHHLDIIKGEHLEQWYRKINPNTSVPTLLHLKTNKTLTESLPISLFLQQTYPQNPLLPKDSFKKAQILSFCQIINSGIHPYHNLKTMKYIDKMSGQGSGRKFGRYWLQQGLKVLQGMVCSKYAFGEQLTLGDVFLYPVLIGSCKRLQINLKNYPNLQNIQTQLNKHQQFKQILNL